MTLLLGGVLGEWAGVGVSNGSGADEVDVAGRLGQLGLEVGAGLKKWWCIWLFGALGNTNI